jgi:hypothetical protein
MQMRRFKRPQQAQLFLSVFGVLRNLFKIGHYKLSAEERVSKLKEAFAYWYQITSQPNCTKMKQGLVLISFYSAADYLTPPIILKIARKKLSTYFLHFLSQ